MRAIDNLAAMKDALENDLRLAGNLILEFPGSTATEVEETLAALAAACPFRRSSPPPSSSARAARWTRPRTPSA